MVIRCVIGLAIGLVFAHFDWFVTALRKRVDRLRPQESANWQSEKVIPPSITGSLERLFFILVVAFNVSGHRHDDLARCHDRARYQPHNCRVTPACTHHQMRSRT